MRVKLTYWAIDKWREVELDIPGPFCIGKKCAGCRRVDRRNLSCVRAQVNASTDVLDPRGSFTLEGLDDAS